VLHSPHTAKVLFPVPDDRVFLLTVLNAANAVAVLALELSPILCPTEVINVKDFRHVFYRKVKH
jgi:hypothetical protein